MIRKIPSFFGGVVVVVVVVAGSGLYIDVTKGVGFNEFRWNPTGWRVVKKTQSSRGHLKCMAP